VDAAHRLPTEVGGPSGKFMESLDLEFSTRILTMNRLDKA